jgi:CRISPR-associated protein Csm4
MTVDAYDCYRLTIRLKSPFGTPWQADTIMGHLAWLAAHREGKEGVKAFLAPFMEGKPPFVLSDGFPAGLLPKPLGYRQRREVRDLDSYADEKLTRKADFLTLKDFEAVRSGREVEAVPVSSPWLGIETLHASISRETGTTGEGGNLFTTDSWVLRQEMWNDEGALLSLYACVLEGWIEKIETMFADLASVGFGRDKSVGLGHFEFVSKKRWNGFQEIPAANGFVSLSTFVPGPSDPTEGKWAVNIKYGKLGEGAGGGNPFKKPLLQFKPGAVFYTGESPKRFYGRVVKDIAPGFPEAVQICYCFAVPYVIR